MVVPIPIAIGMGGRHTILIETNVLFKIFAQMVELVDTPG